MDKRKDIFYHPECSLYSCTCDVRKRKDAIFFPPVQFAIYWRVPLELKTARKSYCVRCNNEKWMWIDDGLKIYIDIYLFSCRCCSLQFSLPKDIRLDKWKWKLLNAHVILLNWHINWWLYVFTLNFNSFFFLLSFHQKQHCDGNGVKKLNADGPNEVIPTQDSHAPLQFYKYLAHILVAYLFKIYLYT